MRSRSRTALRLAALPLWALCAPTLAAQGAWEAGAAGSVFAAYTRQDTRRGADGPATWGWVAADVGRTVGRGRAGVDAMLMLDPLVQGACGYPRLMSGMAVCSYAPTEDRSHAHPLVMRLAARAEHPLGPLSASLDAALVGDPVLGVTTYMHRASAAADPVVPITAHETTPAHGAGGALTLGVGTERVHAEVSLFNGGDRDSDPWDLDLGGLRSWAARLRWRPATGLDLYGGVGVLQSSGGHHAGAGSMRVESAALEWSGAPAGIRASATAAATRLAIEDHAERALLLELLARRGRHTVFARGEWAERADQGLEVVSRPDGSHDHFVVFYPYEVGEVAAGYAVRVLDAWGTGLELGSRYALTMVPVSLESRYGTGPAHSVSVFLNLRTGARQAPAHAHAHMAAE